MSVEAMWGAFCAHTKAEPGGYRLVEFGDSAALQTELADLVAGGPKRATTSLLRSYAAGEVLPAPGDYGVVVDGHGVPLCVVHTTRVDILPFQDVDEQFAFDEGEGDRTLQSWRAIHRRYFEREGNREGFEFSDALEVVCERFDVVWPRAGSQPNEPTPR
jgi:uncharacterized protein YhfF